MLLNLKLNAREFVFGAYVMMSITSFAAYYVDRRAARAGNSRIPESGLHFLELCFGWPGAWLAQRLLRHKHRKPMYQIVFWLIVLFHALAWFALNLVR